MNANLWQGRFMEILNEKFPKSVDLVEALSNLLCIERTAVYRRIRNEVPFTANEVAKIATAWHISLDDLVGIYTGKIAFQMFPFNFLNPSKQDIENLSQKIQVFESLENNPNSEYTFVCNNLSRSLAIGFDMLYKFNIFKWGYEFSNEDINTPLSQITIPTEIQSIARRYYKNLKNVATTYMFLDHLLFDNLINEIVFFHSIMLISDEEKELIKNDLTNLMNYMLEVATTGCFPETKKKVYIYISTLNVNTNYSYLYTDTIKLCRVHAFNKYDIISYNPEMIETFRTWMHRKKRTAILISEVDERNRIAFFVKLRKLIDSL
jgi:hypothetical protein